MSLSPLFTSVPAKKNNKYPWWVLFFQVIRAMLQDYPAEKCFLRRLATAQWREPNYGKHNPVKSCDFRRHSASQQKADINWKGGLRASHTALLQTLTLPCSVYYPAVRRLCIHTYEKPRLRAKPYMPRHRKPQQQFTTSKDQHDRNELQARKPFLMSALLRDGSKSSCNTAKLCVIMRGSWQEGKTGKQNTMR